MRHSDARTPVPPRFVSFQVRYEHSGRDLTFVRLAVPLLRRFFSLPLRAGAARGGRGGFQAGPPAGLPERRRPGLPGSWGTPMRASPALRAGAVEMPGGGAAGRLSDPGGTGRARPLPRAGAAFRLSDGVGSRDC